MSVGWENVVAGKGIELALIGTSIIFLSLLAISGFIYLLPRVLALIATLSGRNAAAPISTEIKKEPLSVAEKEAIIALVLHLELEYQSGESGSVTLRPHESRSIWSSSARMRSLSSWSHHA
ncbi:MAG: hypothetical protein RBR43_05575 [Desulfuromonadaceae bacterium]|nr:hypothetical protein [Desulfuromonas sp.]MDY0185330.1 hypothetical protein [Desulfuromonadaceae bacterium]